MARIPVTLQACALGVVAIATTRISPAAPPPISYSRQILPLFKSQCLACHAGATPASGYSMETRERLVSGGRHGAAILVGKGAESSLVKYLTGENKPKMPPNGALDLEKVALIRRWIDEGAKIDSDKVPEAATNAANRNSSPSNINTQNLVRNPAPVTALAYSPDGALLAIGGYKTVRLIDSSSGQISKTLTGMADQVQALAWSSNGKLLAVAGGAPAVAGEIILFDTTTWKPLRKLQGHSEVVYAVAWKPDSMEIATGSLDKTACIWDAETGKAVRTIKDHADGVMGVAYSPDGKLFATASLDRSAKLYDTSTWKRQSALVAHQDGVLRVAFQQNGKRLATAGMDRTVRLWTIKPGTIENPDRTLGEGDVVNSCMFSQDGSLLIWGANNSTVKVFNGDGTQQRSDFKDAKDWVYSVAVTRDNQKVAAGTQEGKVFFWDLKANKLIQQIEMPVGTATGHSLSK